MTRIAKRLTLLLLALAMTSTASAKLYKWTDKDGIVNYADTPHDFPTYTPSPAPRSSQEAKTEKPSAVSQTAATQVDKDGQASSADAAAAAVPEEAPIDAPATCKLAADNLKEVVPTWKALLDEHAAENLDVTVMHQEMGAGLFTNKLLRRCADDLILHEQVYECLARASDNYIAAACVHPMLNSSRWQYRPGSAPPPPSLLF